MAKKLDLDRAAFLNSGSIILTIEGQAVEAKPREFSTGSLGYYASGKVLKKLDDGTVAPMQVSANIVLHGTK